MSKVAIMIYGGFYRKRSRYLFGKLPPEKRANELMAYFQAHLSYKDESHELYRIFYYDCYPYDKSVYHPFLKKNINLKKTELYKWSTEFLGQLKSKRKVALRMGLLSDITARYLLSYKIQKSIG